MSFYIALPEDEASETGQQVRANMSRIHEVHPGMLRRFYDVFRELMYRPGPLHRWQREMIATVVSSENGCHY